MAKYTVKYACGYGVHEEQLFGKNTERESKIQWMENCMVCPECYKKQKEEEAKKMGIVVTFTAPSNYKGANVIISVLGDTKPIKEELKGLGFRFTDLYESGFFGMLSMRAPEKAWSKTVFYETLPDEMKAFEEKIKITKLENRLTDVDMAMLATAAKEVEANAGKVAEAEAEIAKLEKPSRPACYPTGYWNKTIYSGNRVYIDNKEKKLTSEEAKEIKDYQKRFKEWKEACKKIMEEKGV